MEYLYKPLIGLIEPAPSPVAEQEFHTFLPPGVWMATCRVPFFELSQTGLNDTIKSILDMTAMLTNIPADVLVINSMTGTCLRGVELKNALQQRTGVPTVTAAQAVAEALKQRGWSRVRTVSGFNQELAFVEKAFFSGHNVKLDILNIHEKLGTEAKHVWDTGLMDKVRLLEVLAATDFSDVDVLMFDAPFFDLTDIWQKIEAIAGIPVLSSNQIVLYKALKILGKPTDHLLISKYFK